MTTTTATPTIRDLIEFVYDSTTTTAKAVVSEFNVLLTDAAELLNTLDESDGTLYHDGEGNYSVEDKDEALEDILHAHKMGGGLKLDTELPVNKPKKARKKATTTKKKATTKKASTKKASTKKKTTKKAGTKKKATRKKVTKKSESPIADAIVASASSPDGEATADIANGTVTTTVEDKPKEKKKRNVKPRASRFVEDEGEAQTLGVDVGTEVKVCVDCRETYAKFGGQFRPRQRNPEPGMEKHVQPRCISCDKKRSRRKSRFTGLRRAIGIEDIGNPEIIVTHPDRKKGGVPDGKFSVALIDDTVDGFNANLRGVLVNMAQGLIKLRWTSGDSPEIVGATKKAIAACKAPKALIVLPTKSKPKPKAKPKAEAEDTTEDAPKPKAKKKTPRKKAAKKKATPKAKKKTKAEEAADLDW